MLAHAKFAYNKSTSQTTSRNPFEVVYGKNPTSLLDLTPLVVEKNFSGDAEERAKQIKKLYQQVRDKILEKKMQKYKKQANKHRKPIAFKEGDKVWIHLRKERFPNRKFPKLQPRAHSPFKVLQRIVENAY